jgi:hypothetical protein
MLPAAFEQFAVSVTACVSAGCEGDAPTEQPNVPPPVLEEQVSVLTLSHEQFSPLIVIVAACDGDDAGTARRRRVIEAAASAHAAGRTSDRFIFRLPGGTPISGPNGPCKFRASNYNKNN